MPPLGYTLETGKLIQVTPLSVRGLSCFDKTLDSEQGSALDIRTITHQILKEFQSFCAPC